MSASLLTIFPGPTVSARWQFSQLSQCNSGRSKLCVRPCCNWVPQKRRFENGSLRFLGSWTHFGKNLKLGFSPTRSRKAGGKSVTASVEEEETKAGGKFPFFQGVSKQLLTEVAETLEKELGPHLSPSETPPDVKHFTSARGTAEGSVVLRGGNDGKIDFTLTSWIHAVLPFGTLDIGTTVVMLGAEIDSPHWLFEFILSNNILVVVLDHLPRKDMVLDSTYLNRFYGDPGLDRIRALLDSAPGCKPYVAPVLFIRNVVSPTAVFIRLTSEGEVSLDEQIAQALYPTVSQMLRAWLDSFQTRGLQVQDVDGMLRRDQEIKDKGVEVDLSSNLPRIYGQEVADRIVQAFRSGK